MSFEEGLRLVAVRGEAMAAAADADHSGMAALLGGEEYDAERLAIIREMRAILEEERPWIELFHPEDYALYHGWLRGVKPAGISNPTAKYRNLEPELRRARRTSWNEPVLWPAAVLIAAAVGLTVPGFVTFFRERQ